MVFQDLRITRGGREALHAFKSSLKNYTSHLTKNSVFIFTCGKRPDNGNTNRERLMKYASEHLKEFRFFKAEKIFKVIGEEEGRDWLTIEKQLADYSDCIIIVLGSESTFSELGAFMLEDGIAKNVLVINDIEHKNSDSFINLGPLKKLDKKSNFKPVIYTKYKNFSKCFGVVEERIQSLKRERNKRVDLKKYSAFEALQAKDRLLFVLDLIAILSPVKQREVLEMLKFIYGEEESYDDIYTSIPLLLALDLVKKEEGYLIRTLNESRFYYSFIGIDINVIRSAILNNYFKNSRERFELLKSRLK
ncbi:retron St85 family effector protein [Fodinibius halophilus]|uniref:Uncharacterized protein n=1 Tax=Fodinibius halophilus TaxID=1736908 RepID=A0A6M1TGQ2_9BACT|nr:retron St85 family effector protein [Fodinibius halophilus]NGP89282.1 hypothetical protein [Fodinibius halophilus]